MTSCWAWEMGKKKEPKQIMGRKDSQDLDGLPTKSNREPKPLRLNGNEPTTLPQHGGKGQKSITVMASRLHPYMQFGHLH